MSLAKVNTEETSLAVVKTENLFCGALFEPSRSAYRDVVKRRKNDTSRYDMKKVSATTQQNQTYSESRDDFVTVFTHLLYYKGEAVWRIETYSQIPTDKTGEYSSTCRLTHGGLEVTIYRLGDTVLGDHRSTVHRRRYDTKSLVEGSGMAYQMFGEKVQRSLGDNCQIMNQEALHNEHLAPYIVILDDEKAEHGNNDDSESDISGSDSAYTDDDDDDTATLDTFEGRVDDDGYGYYDGRQDRETRNETSRGGGNRDKMIVTPPRNHDKMIVSPPRARNLKKEKRAPRREESEDFYSFNNLLKFLH